MKFLSSILLLFLLCLIEQTYCIKLKWGILSAGRIANDFILSLNNFKKEDHEVVAIASQNGTRAKNYASKFNIPQSYDNYNDLAKDSNVNVVYIATINPYHFAAIKLMLENKKHVLAEKPMVVHPEDARELFEIAKENNVVLMEALWSRFLPAYIQVTELIQNGTIGQIEHISAYHLIGGASIERLSNIKLAGGVSLDIGIYSLHAILTAVNFTRPQEMKVYGRKLAENSTDCTVTGILKLDNNVTGSFVMTSVATRQTNEKLSHVVYIGTNGYIKIPYPMNGPNSYVINGQTIETSVMDDQDGYLWYSSAGLRYQAQEIKNVIEDYRLTSDKMTPEMTYLFADLVAEMHEQLGIKFEPTIRNYEFSRIV